MLKASTGTKPKYKYQKLVEPDSIRLVDLQPGDITNPVVCNITYTTLQASAVVGRHVVMWSDPFEYDVAGYTALSYTVRATRISPFIT